MMKSPTWLRERSLRTNGVHIVSSAGCYFSVGCYRIWFQNLLAFAEFLVMVLRVNSRIGGGGGYASIKTPPACPCLVGDRYMHFSCL